MLITPSGVGKRELEPASLIVQKLDGTIVSGRGKSSREAKLHAAIYRIRTEIGAVVHTHPAAATAFAMCGQTLPDNCLVEVPAVIGKIALAGYAPAKCENGGGGQRCDLYAESWRCHLRKRFDSGFQQDGDGGKCSKDNLLCETAWRDQGILNVREEKREFEISDGEMETSYETKISG